MKKQDFKKCEELLNEMSHVDDFLNGLDGGTVALKFGSTDLTEVSDDFHDKCTTHFFELLKARKSEIVSVLESL